MPALRHLRHALAGHAGGDRARGRASTCCSPTPTETPGPIGLAAPGEGAALLEAEAARLSPGRAGRPEETANGALFPASDQYSFMTR